MNSESISRQGNTGDTLPAPASSAPLTKAQQKAAAKKAEKAHKAAAKKAEEAHKAAEKNAAEAAATKRSADVDKADGKTKLSPEEKTAFWADQTPNTARLKNAPKPWIDLTSASSSKRGAVLEQVQSGGMSHTALVDALNEPKYSWPLGVAVEYKSKLPRPAHLGLAHPGHEYHLPTGEALLVLAGAHDKAELFADTLFECDEKAIKHACYQLQRGAFISTNCLREVVKQATKRGVEATEFDPAEISWRELKATKLREIRDPNAMMFRAHMVVAAFLVGESRDVAQDKHIVPAFEKLKVILELQVDSTPYQAIATGICIAGTMRAILNEVERGAKNAKRVEFIVDCVGEALEAIPMAGKAISAVVGCFAPVVGDAVKKKHKDISGLVRRIGAQIEDAVFRTLQAEVGEDNEVTLKDPMDAILFNAHLAKTLKHCELSY